VQHAYDLADYQGEVELSWAKVAYDPEHHELFVVAGETVSVFKRGLKVFEFKTAPEVGLAFSVAPLENGDLLVASVRGAFRLDFRGGLIGRFEVKGAPGGLADFRPNFVQRVAGKLYLASTPAHRVLVVEEDGTFVASYDLAALAFKNKVTDDHEITGFSVDPQGNLLFTVPALFKAYIVSPDGSVRDFGTPGSRNGGFNVVGAIVRDQRGILYVADVLRSVVIVFDHELQYVGEIGGLGTHQESLFAPASLAVGDDFLFVSQGASRGVRVFRVVAD
jgi:hypothetical protein